ncbi:MAG: hypothetical protein PHR26_00255 [Candidatus ainarchaeum sp.]|nr:hypothetical protein [Candidatus ainarchaeum sp.]MDD3975647.1 hypothetical protein [Candidatus ainarchaeum sp.]
MFLKNKKAQFSIEVLFIIVFVILFIFIYDNLSKDNVYTLEVNKIISDQKEIALLINEYLAYTESINNYDSNFNLNNYNSILKIPNIRTLSFKANCNINISNDSIYIFTDYKGKKYIEYTLPTKFNMFSTDVNTFCGDELKCSYNLSTYKVICS